MPWVGLIGRWFLFGWICTGLLPAQMPLTPAAERLVNKTFDQVALGELVSHKLTCNARPWRPFFDFAFRFEIGYVVQCPYRQFYGGENHLVAVARVRSVDGKATILGEMYGVPAVPSNMRAKLNINKLKGDLEFSGAIGVGVGEYQIELLVADDQNRYFTKKWRVQAERRGAEKKAEVSLLPGEVAPLLKANFGKRDVVNGKPMRLTVLLDASPISPFSRKLRAWDRAFLLGSMESLMRQVPSASIKLVAFNIDQQQELYRADNLDGKTFPKLSDALRQLELGTVSYGALRRPDGWATLLSRLLIKESASADAVVFLGPQLRTYAKIPRDSLPCRDSGPPLFYLKYKAIVGLEYADSIDYITKDCGGRVLGFHSPGELGAAIEKMRDALRPN